MNPIILETIFDSIACKVMSRDKEPIKCILVQHPEHFVEAEATTRRRKETRIDMPFHEVSFNGKKLRDGDEIGSELVIEPREWQRVTCKHLLNETLNVLECKASTKRARPRKTSGINHLARFSGSTTRAR